MALRSKSLLQLNSYSGYLNFVGRTSGIVHFPTHWLAAGSRFTMLRQQYVTSDLSLHQHLRCASSRLRTKPPDILVCIDPEWIAANSKAQHLPSIIKSCAHRDAYTVYSASAAEIYHRSTNSLCENTALVVCSSKLLTANFRLQTSLEAFFTNNGSILLLSGEDETVSMPPSFEKIMSQHDVLPIGEVKVQVKRIIKPDAASVKATKNGVLVHAKCKDTLISDLQLLKALLRVFDIETADDTVCDAGQSLTPAGCFYVKSFKTDAKVDCSLLDDFCGNLRRPTALDVHAKSLGNALEPTDVKAFNVKAYFAALHSKRFGHGIMYASIIGTTMSVFDPLIPAFYRTRQALDSAGSQEPDCTVLRTLRRFDLGRSSFVAVADRQTAGVGRGGNQWLSPVGQLCFTLLVEIDSFRDWLLFERLSIMQHLVALSLVEAVAELVSQQADLHADVLQRVRSSIRIKWPNDVYFVDETGMKVKLGGVLVKSSLFPDVAFLSIGVGVNVDNDRPTVSVNQVLQSCGAKKVSRELLLAAFLTRFERVIDRYATMAEEKALQTFRESYYASWMHSEQLVTVVLPSGNRIAAQVMGVDSFGFLIAKDLECGECMSLQPDGNSFDILENLIRTK